VEAKDIHARYLVPPNSSPLRELAHAIDAALTLRKPATARDEVSYLRISRDRARLVREAAREIIRDRDIENDERDVMVVVVRLRERTGQLGDDTCDLAPGHD
jgi:hypothetical protein